MSSLPIFTLLVIDDVFNKTETDYFAGGGIRFNDDDLAAILATAPRPLSKVS